MRRILLTIAMMLSFNALYAQQRVVYTINDAWNFAREGESATVVDIPHTWNAQDADDDQPGYYRGTASYSRKIYIPESMQGRCVDIYFEGANQELSLFVNGNLVGEHKGGYTRFNFDLTPYVQFGRDNDFQIILTNRHNPDIPPLSADFTFYGGIYRDVYLRFVNPVHITTDNYASGGIYVSTPAVSASSALVEVRTLLDNSSASRQSVTLETEIRNAEGETVARASAPLKLAAGEKRKENIQSFSITDPHLWDTEDPYLYTVHTRILDRKSAALLDQFSQPLGLRWFSFDPEQGFFLNGRHCKLIGTARHQDYCRAGNALGDQFHLRDIELLKEMGGNFLRVSHYPQDPTVLETCDRLGILASVEIPVVNAVTESQAFLDNSLEMAVEMVRQDYNHPSVIIWGYMNEILLRQPYEGGEELDRYYQFTEKVARALEDKIREEDPSRYTMMAYHNAPSRYEKAHLTEIPMILGWNLYQGWYEPDINEFERLLDRAHEQYKGKVLMVTEYGPGVDPRVHSSRPERFDFSQEYGLVYHRHYLDRILERPFIAGSAIWNLNDFYSESRVDAVPHVNNKGVTGLDREVKDSYLFYKARLSAKPFIAIGNREWKSRGGAETSDAQCVQSVPVFTNAASATMCVNGKSIGETTAEAGVAMFEVPFVDGVNVLEVSALKDGVSVRDLLYVNFDLVPGRMEELTQINVMLGSPRYFDDRRGGLAWIPEQEYRPGSWGYVGGKPYRRPTGFGTMLGSEVDIAGTDQNPVFQTQRVGIEAFKADVPDGEYSVYLYFAELDKDIKRQSLAYNLGAETSEVSVSERIFNVSINDVPVLENFDIARQYGAARAVVKKFVTLVSDGEGITVSFDRVSGEPVLNAVRIYKNH